MQVDWVMLFRGCCHVNEYAELMTNQLRLVNLARSARVLKKYDFPRHIVKLIHAKAAIWRHAKRSADFTAYRSAYRVSKAIIRQFRKIKRIEVFTRVALNCFSLTYVIN